MYLNKVFVFGNLTRDPERRSLPSGQAVVSFGLATNRVFIDRDGQKKETVEFHNIVIFGKTAETAAQYLKKGSSVLIEGRLRTNNWIDNVGVKHYKTEIITERMQFGPRTASTGGFQAPTETKPNQAIQPEPEIPVIEEEVANNPGPISGEGLIDDNEIDIKDIPF